MNLESLVCRARQGDVRAFVERAHGFQHVAFYSARSSRSLSRTLHPPRRNPRWCNRGAVHLPRHPWRPIRRSRRSVTATTLPS